MKNNFEIFTNHLDKSLLNELFNGGRIIYKFLLNEKGFVLVEREEPLINKSNNLPYKFVSYEFSPNSIEFYAACEFMQSKGESKKSVIKRALAKFYDR